MEVLLNLSGFYKLDFETETEILWLFFPDKNIQKVNDAFENTEGSSVCENGSKFCSRSFWAHRPLFEPWFVPLSLRPSLPPSADVLF